MVFHMLAVFDRQTARAPSGLESWKLTPSSGTSLFPTEAEGLQQEDKCKEALLQVFDCSKPSARHLELLGQGNGFTFEASPYCSYATRADVHVLFAGEVSDWPGIDVVSAAHNAFIRNEEPPEADDAHWLLDFYATFGDHSSPGMTGIALERLAQVRGSFSFVIFDQAQHRVFAARDGEGCQPLYWGSTDEGQLMFSTHPGDLAGCSPTATLFPAGTLFATERHMVAYQPGDKGWVIAQDDWPGQLLSFLSDGAAGWRGVRAIPRITSKGVLCGAVYKVASLSDLHKAVH